MSVYYFPELLGSDEIIYVKMLHKAVKTDEVVVSHS